MKPKSIGSVETTFDLGRSFATKAKEQAEYMEIIGSGKLGCDQMLLGKMLWGTDMIRLDISFTIKSVKIKADDMEWGGKLKGCSAETLINELVWQGVNYERVI